MNHLLPSSIARLCAALTALFIIFFSWLSFLNILIAASVVPPLMAIFCANFSALILSLINNRIEPRAVWWTNCLAIFLLTPSLAAVFSNKLMNKKQAYYKAYYVYIQLVLL